MDLETYVQTNRPRPYKGCPWYEGGKMSETGQDLEGSLKCYMKMYDKVFRENHDLRAQLAEAQKEIEKKNSKTWCAYCGFEIDIDDEASTKISEHIMNCPKHPIRIYERHSEALEAENAALRERLKKVEEVYKMRDPSVSQMWQAIKAACE